MFLDSGWMDEITQECLNDNLTEEDYKKKIDSVKRFERQLTDNGYLVMKFFFHIKPYIRLHLCRNMLCPAQLK